MLCLFCVQSFFKKHLILWAIGRLSFDGMLFANSSFLLVYSSPYSNQCTRLFAFLFTHLCSMILSYLAKQTIVIKLDTLWKFTGWSVNHTQHYCIFRCYFWLSQIFSSTPQFWRANMQWIPSVRFYQHN